MTGSGVFPKIDGDVLYASEVNSFREKVIGFVQQDYRPSISGTDYQILGGSVLYSGTFPSLVYSHLKVQFPMYDDNSNSAIAFKAHVRFSGTHLNISGNDQTLFASTIPCGITYQYILESGTTNFGGNMGSPFVVFVEGKNSDTGGKIGNLIVTGA